MAAVASKLIEEHLIGTELSDAIVEQIEMAMDSNDSSQSSYHLSCMKYLGELYVNQGINFDTTLSVLEFVDKSLSARLKQNDRFPVFAICELLDTCAKYLQQLDGSERKRRCEEFQEKGGLSFVKSFKEKLIKEFANMKHVDSLLQNRVNDILARYNDEPLPDWNSSYSTPPAEDAKNDGMIGKTKQNSEEKEKVQEATKDFKSRLDEINRGVGGSLTPKNKLCQSFKMANRLKQALNPSSSVDCELKEQWKEREFILCTEQKPGQVQVSRITVSESYEKQCQAQSHKKRKPKNVKNITLKLIHQLSDSATDDEDQRPYHRYAVVLTTKQNQTWEEKICRTFQSFVWFEIHSI
ncbi:hypothetical protein RFI_26155 [Reticulomyxa filosa]|uniref:MIF4G domain-containing protein n=1 Tax=Reticulomyxa filosa TaxID=46433 RepID=X6MCP2_RETFI|nr:hypothetical protein RFI_26155 [Reticulomyxa filosa]|eukprot:ETO11222.1 hypothetical protein RFI_26155 [Reticulomyxa filosa]